MGPAPRASGTEGRGGVPPRPPPPVAQTPRRSRTAVAGQGPPGAWASRGSPVLSARTASPSRRRFRGWPAKARGGALRRACLGSRAARLPPGGRAEPGGRRHAPPGPHGVAVPSRACAGCRGRGGRSSVRRTLHLLGRPPRGHLVSHTCALGPPDMRRLLSSDRPRAA